MRRLLLKELLAFPTIYALDYSPFLRCVGWILKTCDLHKVNIRVLLRMAVFPVHNIIPCKQRRCLNFSASRNRLLHEISIHESGHYPQFPMRYTATWFVCRIRCCGLACIGRYLQLKLEEHHLDPTLELIFGMLLFLLWDIIQAVLNLISSLKRKPAKKKKGEVKVVTLQRPLILTTPRKGETIYENFTIQLMLMCLIFYFEV